MISLLNFLLTFPENLYFLPNVCEINKFHDVIYCIFLKYCRKQISNIEFNILKVVRLNEIKIYFHSLFLKQDYCKQEIF
jgi:hypothetical protein